MLNKILGLVAAPFTPMDECGDIALATVERQAEYLAAVRVTGVFVGGTTGEGASLTLDERMQLAERWVQVAGRNLVVLVHVGTNCMKDSQALAAHASRIKAHGIGALSPSFFKPKLAEDLVRFLAPVAHAASDLPFYYYHLPSFTGVNIPARDVLAVAAGSIPTLAGVKFTYEDMDDFRACLAMDGGRMDCLFGRDEKLVDGLAAGARGAIGSTYNIAPGLSRRIIDAFELGDLARAARLQAMSARFIDIVYGKYGGLPAAKALSKCIVDLGPVRAPLAGLPPDRERALIDEVEAAGFPKFAEH